MPLGPLGVALPGHLCGPKLYYNLAMPLNTHLPLYMFIISRFENEATNTHKGGDLRQNYQITFPYVLHVFLSHCNVVLINRCWKGQFNWERGREGVAF